MGGGGEERGEERESYVRGREYGEGRERGSGRGGGGEVEGAGLVEGMGGGRGGGEEKEEEGRENPRGRKRAWRHCRFFYETGVRSLPPLSQPQPQCGLNPGLCTVDS